MGSNKQRNRVFNHRTKEKERLAYSHTIYAYSSTFRGHLRKKASIKSGAGANDIYKPIWFDYEYMESFLAVPQKPQGPLVVGSRAPHPSK